MKAVIERIFVGLIVLCALGVASLRAQAPVDQSKPTFRSALDLVSIQASVRDKRGRPVGGLTTADFEVRDNGQLKPILSLRSDRRSPVSLAVLVDMSGSMRISSKMAMARRAFDTLLLQLRDGQERQLFTTDLGRFKGALDDFHPFGSTSLYDATAATARRLADRSAAQKAIVILTDGVDTSSTLAAAEVSGLASSIEVPVYIVATVPAIDQVSLMEATDDRAPSSEGADLRDLAEWTGGQLIFASNFVETDVVAASLVNALRHQYVLAIEAANSREWRRLDVRVKRRAATVRARSGYFGG
jgi:Ca-activated chloride channel family protein